MEILETSCRFCLTDRSRDVRMLELDESIEQLFFDLTQIRLTYYSSHPNIPHSICETCYRDLMKCLDIKKLFIDNQIELDKKILIILHNVDIKHELESDIHPSKTETADPYIDHENLSNFEASSQTALICEHNQIDLKECPQCFDLFEHAEFTKHIQTHQNRHSCHSCSYSSPKFDRLQKHCLKVHKTEATIKEKLIKNKVDEKQQCAVCGSFVKNLIEHLKFTHNQAKKSFYCDHCSYSCYFKTKIERHLQKHIPKEFRNLIKCPDCSFLCSRKDALKSHIMTMHQINRQKIYDCQHCKKSFYNTSQLNIHTKSVHQNIRNHLCQYCGKAFFTTKDLKIHSARHFEKNEKCSECDAVFFCRVDLRRHVRHKHMPASIICQIQNCQLKFHTNSQLKTHIKTRHEHLKQYICNFCGSSFAQYNNMKRHIDSVHKALRIHCPVDNCTYSITRKDKYKTHLIKAHKNIDEKMREIVLKNVKYE
ncbi:hypothetical protein ACKWTF_006748 [Chironomus riparius]